MAVTIGSEVVLSAQEKATVESHRYSIAADVSASKMSQKMMHKLDGASPAKLLEVFYTQREHRNLSSETLSRKGVGRLANCIGYLPGATNLDFESDSVRTSTE